MQLEARGLDDFDIESLEGRDKPGVRIVVGDHGAELSGLGEEKGRSLTELAGIGEQADLLGAGDHPFLECRLAGIGFRGATIDIDRTAGEKHAVNIVFLEG